MIFQIRSKRILFIHIPKCAGTSVEAGLNRLSERPIELRNDSPVPELLWGQHNGKQLQHATLPEALENTGLSVEDFDAIFSVVRDPMDRFFSELRWLLSNPYFQSRASIDFLMQKMALQKKDRFPHFKLQREFFQPSDPVAVFDLKDINKLPDYIKSITGVTPVIEKRNASKKDILPRSVVSHENMNRIKDIIAADIEFCKDLGAII
ncbi:sulfotransferase family protein [Leisingera aquaemixtae]|uniref:sulfotransferase family 2 domain-containing protein n=1 Tax=Leisingera aquaemixtae TaxID=1396826 RepID=UPI001C97DFA6|nr:sulfotransferase family 2 domain-containing protein [Leisingera aquaemixtae]MBY6069087.1 sulfotransferase family protein [Leisingera aquaemixtae]